MLGIDQELVQVTPVALELPFEGQSDPGGQHQLTDAREPQPR